LGGSIKFILETVRYSDRLKAVEIDYKSRKITIVGIDEVKESISLRVRNDTEDHTKGMNGDKIDMNDKERQKRDQEVTILV
jgi:hypothetical protein